MHSKKLEETDLWKTYEKEVPFDSGRSCWVRKVYEAAAEYLKDVRITFPNYTLHDEKHILNVLDAMGGLLGDRINALTVGEAELLILTAAMHDLGMVYTEKERQMCYEDSTKCRKFLGECCPELLGCPPEEWPEDIRQWYLRTLHPFRIPEVLQNEGWSTLFEKYPAEAVPRRCVLAVCRAHGEEPEKLRGNRDLEYLPADDTDPLFCALLLRLSDLLDFDDTRAPGVLHGYTACNEKSREEWDKHQASAGFRYPPSPCTDDLPYKARCTSPGVEHAVRDFLNWIDDELGNCIRLQKNCRKEWQQKFPFPRSVGRSEIESDGYMSGDFCMTMDQSQILNLLTGENLYDNRDVFVRELLQNAIDATLLRGKMDSHFKPEDSRIDFWEWNDPDGSIWLRIDDRGTGMTQGMLQRFFLKVGNSYYNSRELERDLRDHEQDENYQGISRFGIGFLSCFLCGDYVEVSTLYFDPKKNRKEMMTDESYDSLHYGLRLKVTGLSGYYTLKNQAMLHPAQNMPSPAHEPAEELKILEQRGYRIAPGTSIAVRLEPGKLGNLDLRKVVEKYLCAARVPVYYNNKRIGRTYEELMQAARKEAGEKIYELPPDKKKEFDECFPAVRGQYPKIAVTVVPLDTDEDRVLPEFSGVLVKYDVRFDKIPQWKVKDLLYEVTGYARVESGFSEIFLKAGRYRETLINGTSWPSLKIRYGSEKVRALEDELEKQPECPKTGEQLGEAWDPFEKHMSPHKAWIAYYDHQHSSAMKIPVYECRYPNIRELASNSQCGNIPCAYQGIIAGDMDDCYNMHMNSSALFLLESRWRPAVAVSRSGISDLPLEVLTATCGILEKYQTLDNTLFTQLRSWGKSSLEEWRKVRTFSLGKWMEENLENFFSEKKRKLQKPCDEGGSAWDPMALENLDDCRSLNQILNQYLRAELQDNYRMKICYEEGQIITFEEKEEDTDVFDLFPPMMFCRAASSQSRQYICAAERVWRRGITADHPFSIWLLENAVKLNRYYQRQFWQIIECLRGDNAKYIVQRCNEIREQLLALPKRHGIDMSSCPRLKGEDFWHFSS